MNDKALGATLLLGGILALIIYVILLFFGGGGFGSFAPGQFTVLWWWGITLVSLILVGAVAFIIIWIGWTLATTPGPAPIETTTAPAGTATASSSNTQVSGEAKKE